MLELLYELEEGTIVMLIGMGVVFTFLVILVYSMQLMSYVVGKLNVLFPEKVAETVAIKKPGAGKEDEQVAIAVAIAMAAKARG